ncbi:unnamed protein product [Parascedosporium putredinis]|uniref:Uncharacterized protein n=1 Tax=Parascedosporium putredinis TaxID=1442378 RepID=A0A9P1HCZ4_9PEZI|nr:unnamed protein product [Parascedosporium putredinis]CAI8003499.1 unnamed protein product [Parascedosporium putredinis]
MTNFVEEGPCFPEATALAGIIAHRVARIAVVGKAWNDFLEEAGPRVREMTTHDTEGDTTIIVAAQRRMSEYDILLHGVMGIEYEARHHRLARRLKRASVEDERFLEIFVEAVGL